MRFGRLSVLLAVLWSGCFSTVNTVGDGPQGGEVRVHRIWYAGWGFVTISRLDTRNVVGASDHYRVTHGMRAMDVFINIFCGPFGFFRTTTRVEK